MQTPGRKGEKEIRFDMVSKKVIPTALSKRSTMNNAASTRKGMSVSKSGVISSAMSAKPEKVKVF